MDKGIKVQIVGVKPVNFTNDEGKCFQSTKVYAIIPSSNDDVVGSEVQELKLPYDKFDKFKGKSFPLTGTIIVGDFNLSKCTFKCVDIIL